jgi:hypothetical protein
LANRDDEPWPEEDADLAEFDLLVGFVVACGAQDHELDIPLVSLELRA